MKDRNGHEITFHVGDALGTAMAEGRHPAHPSNTDVTDNVPGSKHRDRTREYITRDSIRGEKGTDSP